MKFITLSTDAASYGSEFDPAKLRSFNARIRAAAESAGVVVFEDDPDATMSISEIEQEQGNAEIDWFRHWCSTAYCYGQKQWAAWFRKQIGA